MDDRDRFRFIHDLFEFNDRENVRDNSYLFNIRDVRRNDISGMDEKRPRKLLVSILAFCLMPNHYHLLLKPLVEKGTSLFMKKLNGGYVKYFNNKHERTGTLFERRYKSILVNNQSHFTHLPYYIHLNPLDLVTPEWRERKLRNPKKALDFLNNYRWSSHLDYTGQKNFPSVTQRDFLLEVFNGEKGYTKSIENWLKELDIEEIGDIILE